MKHSVVAVVPVYNHPHRLAEVVAGLRARDLEVILVDDGSNAETAAAVDREARHDGIQVVRLNSNQGKGAAVLAGFSSAAERGFSHAIQLDADGQHDPDAIPSLLQESRQHPDALVSGKPEYDTSVPKIRLYGRYLTHAWVWIETLSFSIADSMCGFRIYPLAATLAVAREETVGRRMDFDTEIMVRLYWRGVRSRFVPVRVTYPVDGISHFHAFADNWRITKMHVRLVFGMLYRLPQLIAKKFAREEPRPGAWARQAERGSLAGMRLLAMIARYIGHAPVRVLLHPVTLYFFIFHRRARRASKQYLARVNRRVAPRLAEITRPTAANVYRHFMAFSNAVFEKLNAWQQPERLPEARINGGELLDTMTTGKRGMLFISAHLGNLEMCRALALRHPQLKVNALVYTRNARKFAALMEGVNAEFRDRLILVEHIGADTAIRLRTLVDDGEIIVIVGDRTPAAENGRVATADFLGRPAPFATGPYLLAHLLECPVGLLFCLRNDDGSYRLDLEPFAERIRLPRAGRQATLNEHASRFAARLEYHALQQPLQWFNFYDFWAADAATGTALAREIKANG